MRKLLIVFGMTVGIVMMMPNSVNACDANKECKSSAKSVSHISTFGDTSNYHTVYESNGNPVNCFITRTAGYHNVDCAGCGMRLISNVRRQCSEIHTDTHCFSRNNMCFY